MTKRALLTGAGGFIGAHTLAHIMHNTDWHLVCVDSFRHKGKTDRIAEMLEAHPDWRERTTIVTHDLAAPFSEQMIHRIGHIDHIVNMASESHVDRSIDDPVPFIENNVALTLNVLEYARTIWNLRDGNTTAPEGSVFVQISTDEVYGAAPQADHPEWDVILPSNPYSASKASQEAIAISYWRTYGVPLVITNTMNNFGEMQDPEKFVPMLIKGIYEGKDVTIHGNEEYIGSRFYLHARNHADAMLFLINRGTPTKYVDNNEIVMPDRFNVVGDTEKNNLELAQEIAALVGKELIYHLEDFHSTRPGHDRRYALDGSKLFALGWQPPISFKESLAKTVEWTLENKQWML